MGVPRRYGARDRGTHGTGGRPRRATARAYRSTEAGGCSSTGTVDAADISNSGSTGTAARVCTAPVCTRDESNSHGASGSPDAGHAGAEAKR